MSETKNNPAMLFERGTDFFQQGDFAAARKDFKQLLELNPPIETEKRAKEMLAKINIDPVELLAGVVVLVLLVALFVFFGLR